MRFTTTQNELVGSVGELRTVASSWAKKNRRHLAIYLLIGSSVFVLEAGSFQLMMQAKLLLPVAATLSYVMAILVHFNLNKFVNFRNFDRTIRDQFGTYIVIVGFGYIVTMIVIELLVHVVDAKPLLAKVAAIFVNIPLGYIGHRYLTFGPGIIAAIRKLRKQRTNPRNTTPA